MISGKLLYLCDKVTYTIEYIAWKYTDSIGLHPIYLIIKDLTKLFFIFIHQIYQNTFLMVTTCMCLDYNNIFGMIR